MRRLLLALTTLAATATVAVAIFATALDEALDRLAEQGRADLALAADRLVLELQRSRDAAVLLAGDPRITRLLGEGSGGASDLLRGTADRIGASDVAILRPDGTVAASASGEVRASGAAGWLVRARQGALGFGWNTDSRTITHAAPIFAPTGPVVGAVAVTRDIEQIEWDWRGEPQAIYFTDADGRVLVTNRQELRAASLEGISMPVDGHDVRRLDAGRYLPEMALHLHRDIVVLGMTAEMLLDISPARALAVNRAMALGAAVLVIAALIFVLMERRRTLQRANETLEARVTQRTAALSEINMRLTREVRERREAQAELAQAQADLVQASRLSALGQMSAGISHELNQPLMAIRSFAQNAGTFLERGDGEKAAANLARIGSLAQRMGAIIRNLRAFARSEPASAEPTDLQAVLDAALEITEARRHGTETRVERPDNPVVAMGDEVRLVQVLTNLISNAVDAGGPILIRIEDGPPRIRVLDNGPGLADPERIFDPFYTTKEVGEGLGLGLSLSYGIVQGLGGEIRGWNTQDGAAVEVTLLAARAEDAAA
ncbi:sensor histidine kinase [Jannaschia aquimarina]|uniref:C4-dicarboxylate transport sensor protein DctB n=1 Tax=Jannaschia aquimarina TaxID=935700 RepID=A0A0D1DBC0_9RHOB|nr:ATP-binding protein [Jannaschia aquimarina]KIT17248.1 C4-dicarboxylate transport sensor protein DctB [Jannaschia aquimarina]SNT19075.1 two-component system, NtrC family, C4-dicarboxylate transport sensor histidine kinase DctB [Jannaschia aquimarina]